MSLLGTATSRGETPITLEEALGLPERLKINSNFRLRYEYLDNQFRAGRPGSDQILALRTRVNTRLRFTDWLAAAAELQDSRAYLADDNTPVGTGLVNAAELLNGYIELNVEGFFHGRNRLRGGRMTLDLGSRRLVARNRYRNTSNAFTGVEWRWRGEDGNALRAFYTLPVQRLPSERDRLVNNDVEFDATSSDYQFFGLFYEDVLPWNDPAELYLFGLHEKEPYDTSDGETTSLRKLGTPGFRLLRDPAAGHFDYEFETALQFGRSNASLTGSRELDHFAHFHHVALGYTFEKPWSPRVLLHYAYGSGDDDPTDGSNDRFDRLFGARRFDYGPTSIYAAFSLTNINSPGVRLQVKPESRWSAFVDYRAVWLASKRDEWAATGVQDPDGLSGSFVGHQLELRVRFQLLPGNLTLEFGSAHLIAGEFIERAPNSNGGDSNYVYTQMTLAL